jgi:predicted metalloprotease
MRFNPKANIGGGRIGSGGSGGGGGGLGGLGGGGLGGGRLPIPGGFGIKGTIVIIVLYLLLQMCTGGGLPGPSLGQDNSSTPTKTDTGSYDSCKSGADANKSRLCERKGIMASLESFWSAQLKSDFKPATLITFSGSTQTACGAASAAMGPFYCPTDQQIYEDPSFYKDMLEGQLGGSDSPFVEPYVIGHEFGHHIQNITGQMGNVRTQQGENSDAVKLELQADCYAGLWSHYATQAPDANGVPIFSDITDQDIQDAIGAAKTVGDDAIQQKTQGSVNPDSWTHGSSANRMKWFKTGFDGGTFESCNIWK